MRLIKTLLLGTAAALIFAGASAEAGVISLPLSGATGGLPFNGTFNKFPDNALLDPFDYDPADPTSASPDQVFNGAGQNLFFTKGTAADNWWQANISIAAGETLEYLDVWGRDTTAEENRTQDLVITLSDGVNSWSNATPWNGVGGPTDYGRFDFTTAGVTNNLLTGATSVRIDHSDASTLILMLAEVRAAGSQIPEPTGAALTLLGLGALVAFRRRR